MNEQQKLAWTSQSIENDMLNVSANKHSKITKDNTMCAISMGFGGFWLLVSRMRKQTYGARATAHLKHNKECDEQNEYSS